MTETEQFSIASRWFESLKQGDLQHIVSLYSKNWLSFHPTFWNEHIRASARVRDYFVDFLSKQPNLVSYDGVLTSLDNRSFLYTGTMKLSFPLNGVQGKPAVARFSFVWVSESDNEWRIIHHHNSVVPTA